MNKSLIRRSIYLLLCVLVIAALGAKVYSINIQKKYSFDAAVYDFLGTQLKYSPGNYSTAEFWEQRKHTKSPAEVKRIDKYLSAPLFKHPPLFAYMISLSKRVFGDGIRSGAYVSALFGTGTIIIVFFLARRLIGPYWALAAALFTAVEPVYTFCSQNVWIEATGTFFAYLGLLFLFAARGRKWFFILSAIAMGAALASKYTYILFLVPVYFVLLFSGREYGRKVPFTYFIIPFLVISPWVAWNYRIYGPGSLRIMLTGYSTVAPAKFMFFSAGIMLPVAVFTALALMKSLLPSRFDAMVSYVKGMPVSTRISGMLKPLSAGFAVSLLAISVPGMLKGLSWGYLPDTGASMSMFRNVPGYFYIPHLVELSPLFMFSYLSLPLIRRWKEEEAILVLLPLIFLVFLSVLGSYEARYAAPVTPALMILACYAAKGLFDTALERLPGWKGYALAVLTGTLIVQSVLKTVYLDLTVVIQNDFIYF